MKNALRVSCALLAVLCAPARADLWIVDASAPPDADFADVQSAVGAASDGDVILLRSGSYVAIVVNDKALTIAADSGASVHVDVLSVTNLAVTRTVQISGLEINEAFFDPTCELLDNEGAVLIEDCQITGQGPAPFRDGQAVRIRDCARVVFSDCLLQSVQSPLNPGYAGVMIEDATVAFYGCEVRGGDGYTGSLFSTGGPGGAGVAIAGASSVFASDTLFVGGDGGFGSSDMGCTDGGNGGIGILLGTGAPSLTLVGGSAQPGAAGGALGPCNPGQPGLPVRVLGGGTLTTLPAGVRRYDVPPLLREGDAFSLDFEGAAGDTLLLFVSLTQDPVYLSLGSGTLVPQEPIYLALQDVIPAGGSLSIPLSLAELGPGIESFGLFEQPVFFNAGEGFVLGTPRHVVHLDGAVP